MLLEEEKITDFVAEKLQIWTHSGFNVHFGDIIALSDREGRESILDQGLIYFFNDFIYNIEETCNATQ